mgnify:CR=1 FL=1
MPTLGNQLAISGKMTINKMVTSRTIQKGIEPLKISPGVKSFSSVTAALTVKTNIPKGGVSRPVSIARIPMMAKASGSKPSAMAKGAKTGTVSKMMEMGTNATSENYRPRGNLNLKNKK